jgi:type IV fimbrial biogenesis protein FimT
MSRQVALSLIELIVTIAVIGITVAIAVPSYRYLTTTNRMASEMNEFIASLHFARSEAIKRGQSVRACTSIDGTNCDASHDWTQGWIIRVDATNTVLGVYPTLSGGDTLVGDANTGAAIGFDQNGFAAGFSGTVTLCDPEKDLQKARGVVIEATGHIALARDESGDGIVEDAAGNNLLCP